MGKCPECKYKVECSLFKQYVNTMNHDCTEFKEWWKVNLYALLKLLDGDTQIQISLKNKEIYDGYSRDYKEITVNNIHLTRYEIKAIWYSKVYNRLMIEL